MHGAAALRGGAISDAGFRLWIYDTPTFKWSEEEHSKEMVSGLEACSCSGATVEQTAKAAWRMA